MGIIQRLSLLIRSNLNDAISRGESPEKMLNQIIVDMRDQLVRAKQEVAVAIADERKLRVQVEDEQKQAHAWEQRAMLALRESRDDLAKQALLRQQEHAERQASLDEAWRRQSAETEKLKGSLIQLNDKIEEAKRKKNLLLAKQKRAQAQRRIHDTMAGLSDRSAFEAFERMAERIEDSERHSLASAEVTETLAGDRLDNAFARLEGSDDVDRRLLELKQKLGLPTGQLPAGSSEEGGSGAAGRSKKPDEGEIREAELDE